MEPVRSIWTTATRTRLVGERAGGRREGGPAERVPTGRSGRSSWNQTCLWVGVYSTPQRLARAAQSSRPRPPSRSGSADVAGRGPGAGSRARDSGRRPRRGRRPSVRRQSTSAAVPACTTALVTSSLVRTTASSTMSAKPQPWRVSRTKARAVATERPTGSKVAAARAVITELLVRSRRACSRRPVARRSAPAGVGLPPGHALRWSWCGRPSDARSYSCHRPGRAPGVAGQPHARLLTFAVCADAGRGVSAQSVCGRCAKLPNCYGLVRQG